MILISSLAMWILEIKEIYSTDVPNSIRLKFPSEWGALKFLNGKERTDKRRLYYLWNENKPEDKKKL